MKNLIILSILLSVMKTEQTLCVARKFSNKRSDSGRFSPINMAEAPEQSFKPITQPKEEDQPEEKIEETEKYIHTVTIPALIGPSHTAHNIEKRYIINRENFICQKEYLQHLIRSIYLSMLMLAHDGVNVPQAWNLHKTGHQSYKVVEKPICLVLPNTPDDIFEPRPCVTRTKNTASKSSK